ncbi:MAG: DUF6580 family putative transport protein [Verrucomicrobiota bacterium]
MKNISGFSGGHVRVAVAVGLCIALLAGFRVVRAAFLPELPNFAPVTAMAVCGAFLLPGAIGWILPLGILMVSDLLLALVVGYPVISSAQLVAWGTILAIVGLARLVARGGFSPLGYFGSVLGGGVIFYLVTNTASWLANPAYPRGLEGLWMSLTTGLPGFPPSWMFFRNALVSDFLFAALILRVWALARRSSTDAVCKAA